MEGVLKLIERDVTKLPPEEPSDSLRAGAAASGQGPGCTLGPQSCSHLAALVPVPSAHLGVTPPVPLQSQVGTGLGRRAWGPASAC